MPLSPAKISGIGRSAKGNVNEIKGVQNPTRAPATNCFFGAAPEQRHSGAPDADAMGLGMPFRKRLSVREEGPQERRIAGISPAPPRQKLLDLFVILA